MVTPATRPPVAEISAKLQQRRKAPKELSSILSRAKGPAKDKETIKLTAAFPTKPPKRTRTPTSKATGAEARGKKRTDDRQPATPKNHKAGRKAEKAKTKPLPTITPEHRQKTSIQTPTTSALSQKDVLEAAATIASALGKQDTTRTTTIPSAAHASTSAAVVSAATWVARPAAPQPDYVRDIRRNVNQLLKVKDQLPGAPEVFIPVGVRGGSGADRRATLDVAAQPEYRRNMEGDRDNRKSHVFTDSQK